jgi:hypothetical protein
MNSRHEITIQETYSNEEMEGDSSSSSAPSANVDPNTSQVTRSTTPNRNTSSSLAPPVSLPRRPSIYGTGEDRIVLDIGSLYIKAGFSGESRPRHVVPAYAGNMKVHWDLDFNGSGGVLKACGENCRIVGEVRYLKSFTDLL